MYKISFCGNEVKNTFVTKTSNNDVREIIFKGARRKTQEESIPERLDFDLLFEDKNKLKCTLTKEKRDGRKCPLNKISFIAKFSQQYMMIMVENITKIDVLEMNMHGKNSKNTIDKFKTIYAYYFS